MARIARTDPERFDRLRSSPRQRRALTTAATAFVERFVEELPSAPAHHPPADRATIERLLAPPPEESVDGAGRRIDELFDSIGTAALTGIETASGRQLSYGSTRPSARTGVRDGAR